MVQFRHILLIEDDPAVAQAVCDALERDGYRTAWKDTGAEGLIFARDQHPSLILLDLRLPDQSGFGVCRQLRQAGLHMPVLILTVQRDEVDRVVGLEIGADDYITKPFSLRELLARVRSALRCAYGEYAIGQGEQLYAQDLLIDLSRGSVQRGAQTLNLTPTEFRLLVYLVRHKGQALTRAQIIQAVWDYAPSPFYNQGTLARRETESDAAMRYFILPSFVCGSLVRYVIGSFPASRRIATYSDKEACFVIK
jgi:DNA-binding response OmpR family regulator